MRKLLKQVNPRKTATRTRMCKGCETLYDENKVKRSLGVESMVYLLGYCSAGCYTRHLNRNTDPVNTEGFVMRPPGIYPSISG